MDLMQYPGVLKGMVGIVNKTIDWALTLNILLTRKRRSVKHVIKSQVKIWLTVQ